MRLKTTSSTRLAGGFIAAVLVAGCAAGLDAGRLGQTQSRLAAKGAIGSVVTLGYRDRPTLQRISDAGIDIHAVDEARTLLRAKVSPAEQSWLRGLGLTLRPEPETAGLDGFDPNYHTYDTLLRDMRALAAAHPGVCTLADLGPTWETTKGKANRNVWGLHISKGDASSKPAVAFIAAQHSREIVTPEIALTLARTLLEGNGTDPEMTAAVEGRDIWIVPMVNPDGHAQVVKGEDWRKNTNSEPLIGFSGLDAAGLGTDLNRNFTFHWGEGGASSEPDSPTFRGREAGSEPETKAIMKLLSSRKFTYLMSYHSYSNLIMWPWGYSDDPPPDPRLPAIGRKLGALTGYRPQQSKDLYRTSGGITDWAFGTHGTLAFTTEIGSWNDGFLPPYARVAQMWKENEKAARYLLKSAAEPGK